MKSIEEELEFRRKNIGIKINGLEFIDVIPVQQQRLDYKVVFKCICGKTHASSYYHFMTGRIKSCGCLKRYRGTHGETNSSEFKILKSMKQRCCNPNSKHYSYYGGRGIRICDRWLDKEKGILNFIEDMGRRPSKDYSIDRIDVNGNYEPSNCRWATIKEQSLNRRNNTFITYKGRTKTIKEWSEITGIATKTLSLRNLANLPIDEIMSKKSLNPGRIKMRPVVLVNIETGEECFYVSTREVRKTYPGFTGSLRTGKTYLGKYKCRYATPEEIERIKQQKSSANQVK